MTDPAVDPRPAKRRGLTLASQAASALLGMLLGLVLHYVLYRIGLPSEPFIYVAF
jgi:hypothetical protein